MSLRHLFADEIGIESALIAGMRVQATHSPVFGRGEGDTLTALAVLAGTRARAMNLARRGARKDLAPALHAMLAMELALRNHFHTDGLDLIVPCPDVLLARPSLVRLVIDALPELGRLPHKLVVMVDAGDAVGTAHVAGIRALRAGGIRVGLTATQTVQVEPAFMPDVLRIDSQAVLDGSRDRGVFELLRALVGSCHARGGMVYAGALATAQELGTAQAMGCDLFEGSYLGAPRLAGAAFEQGPLAVRTGPVAGGTVLPFVRREQNRA